MPHTPASLDRLISMAVTGDRKALEVLLVHYHDPLLEFIDKSLPRRSTPVIMAEDVLQETLIEAFGGIQSFEPRGHAAFFKWLKTIARHRLVNQIKHHGALKRGAGRVRDIQKGVDVSTATSIFRSIAGPGPTPSVIVRRKEAIQAIRSELGNIDPDIRQIVLLRFGQGLEISEIARRMNRTEGAVKMVIHRTLKELRGALGSYLE